MIKNVTISAIRLGFNFQDGQITHSIANGSPSLQCFFEAVLSKSKGAEMIPANGCRLWRITASIMEILFDF